MSTYAAQYETQSQKVREMDEEIASKKAATARLALASLQKHIVSCTAWVREEATQFLKAIEKFPAAKASKPTGGAAKPQPKPAAAIPKAMYLLKRKNVDEESNDAASTAASTSAPVDDLLVFSNSEDAVDKYYSNMVTDAAAKSIDLNILKAWVERSWNRAGDENFSHQIALEKLQEETNTAQRIAKGAISDTKTANKRLQQWRFSAEGQRNQDKWAQWKKEKGQIVTSRRLLGQLKKEVKSALNLISFELEWNRNREYKELLKLEGQKMGVEGIAKTIETATTLPGKATKKPFTKTCPFYVNWSDEASRKRYYKWKSDEIKKEKVNDRLKVEKEAKAVAAKAAAKS